MRDDDDYFMLSGIQHFAFCQRQWALIHIEQQWSENVLTTQGQYVHKRVDDEHADETRGDLRVVRSMPLLSERLGVRGIADVVEFKRVLEESEETVTLDGRTGFWKVLPVEYKRGKPKVDDRDIVQLCAQAICLEEMFKMSISAGEIYYAETRKRESIEFKQPYRLRVEELLSQMSYYYENAITPRAVYKQHCKQCSLFELCQPRLSSLGAKSAAHYIEQNIGGHEELGDY